MATANHTPQPYRSGNRTKLDPDQLRRDRIGLIVGIALLAAMIGLILWLASIGVLPANGTNDIPFIMP